MRAASGGLSGTPSRLLVLILQENDLDDPTTEFEETVEGRTLRVQYFERRRMETHPTAGGSSFQAMVGEVPGVVLLGLLGREVYYRERPAGCPGTLPELVGVVRSYQTTLGCPTAGARAGVRMVALRERPDAVGG